MASRGACVVGLLAGSAAAAEPPTLKVGGRASFTTEARAVGEGFELRTTLSDEVGRPLPNAELRIRASGAAGSPAFRRCGDPRQGSGAELLLSTDKLGRACADVRGMPNGSVELSYQDPRGYFERTSASIQLPQGVLPAFELGFDPPVGTLSLDQPAQEVGLVVRAADGGAAPQGAELAVTLAADGTEHELGRSALDGLGEIHRLTFLSGSFQGPGPARLLGKLQSRDGQTLAHTTLAVMRTVTVSLKASVEARAEPGSVLSVHAESVLGPASSGVVEARSLGRSIAAARVQNGVATLTLPNTGETWGRTLTLEYVGAGPGWLSGPPIEIALLPAGPSYARYVLWVLAAVLTALAVVLGWRRPPRPRPVEEPAAPRVRASVEVLESFGVDGGYRGHVRDAHEGFGIAPAVVSFIGPGPQRPVLLQVRSGHDGAFRVETPSFPSGTQVEVTAPFHATLVAPLPGPGVIELSLTSRRRALLARLVRWAERRGKPWILTQGEPTPAHIARVAAQESEEQVERWARGLEHLAFGPTPPDAANEQAAGVSEDPKVRLD